MRLCGSAACRAHRPDCAGGRRRRAVPPPNRRRNVGQNGRKTSLYCRNAKYATGVEYLPSVRDSCRTCQEANGLPSSRSRVPNSPRNQERGAHGNGQAPPERRPHLVVSNADGRATVQAQPPIAKSCARKRHPAPTEFLLRPTEIPKHLVEQTPRPLKLASDHSEPIVAPGDSCQRRACFFRTYSRIPCFTGVVFAGRSAPNSAECT